MVPVLIWSPIDIGWSLDTVSTILIYIALIFTQTIKEPFKMYVNTQGNIFIGDCSQKTTHLTEDETKIMQKSRKKIVLLNNVGCCAMFLVATSVFLLHVFLVNQVERTNMLFILFWTVACPLYFFYLVHGKQIFASTKLKKAGCWKEKPRRLI